VKQDALPQDTLLYSEAEHVCWLGQVEQGCWIYEGDTVTTARVQGCLPHEDIKAEIHMYMITFINYNHNE
jgi:hypothetical protein